MDHEKTGDYVRSFSDYQTTMAENLSGTIDYDGLTRGKLCPLMDLASVVAMGASCGWAAVELEAIQCKGGSCAWWDDTRQQCAILTLARSAVKIAGKK